MARKKIKKNVGQCCSWGNCSGKDWFWFLVSEAALFGLFYCGLRFLGSSGFLWKNALVLLVLVNVAWFACPVVRRHFYK